MRSSIRAPASISASGDFRSADRNRERSTASKGEPPDNREYTNSELVSSSATTTDSESSAMTADASQIPLKLTGEGKSFPSVKKGATANTTLQNSLINQSALLASRNSASFKEGDRNMRYTVSPG